MLNINGSAEDAGLSSVAYELRKHIHSKGLVLPTQANAITLTGTSTAWELGGKVSLVSSGIAEPFDFHYLNVESMSQTDSYELVIYEGTTVASTAIARARFVANTNQVKQEAIPLLTPILPANKKTCAAVCQKSTVAASVDISVCYHTY